MDNAAKRRKAIAEIEKLAGAVPWGFGNILTDLCFGSNPISAIFDNTQITDTPWIHLRVRPLSRQSAQ